MTAPADVDSATRGRCARIDLDRFARNLDLLRADAGLDRVLVQVPADAYGHGAAAVCRAALEAGAVGFVTGGIAEAVRLREEGIDAPIVCWQHHPDEDFHAHARHDVTPALAGRAQVERAARAGVRTIHLVPDLGGPQLGSPASEWEGLCRAAARAEHDGALRVTGMMATLTGAPDTATAPADALATMRGTGLDPELVHLTDHEAGHPIAGLPQTALRVGAAAYGLSAVPGRTAATAPVLTLTAPVLAVKPAAAGVGVSYGYTYRTAQDTVLLLIPLGYGDGIPRHSGNVAHARVRGTVLPVVGRVAMDALVLDAAELVDAGSVPEPGELATVVSDAGAGCSAEDWARALGTTSLDIVARLTTRVTRIHR